MDTDKVIAQKLFGNSTRRTASGGHTVDHEKIQTPLEATEVAHVFCTGCGAYHSVTEEGKQGLLSIAGDDACSFPDQYFQVGRCVSCTEETEFIEVSVQSL